MTVSTVTSTGIASLSAGSVRSARAGALGRVTAMVDSHSSSTSVWRDRTHGWLLAVDADRAWNLCGMTPIGFR